jgi:para-nitrobenzyl esterase
MAEKGYSKDITAIIGTNLDEWKLFAMMAPGFDKITEAQMLKRLESLVAPESAAKVTAAYKQARQKRGEPAAPPDVLGAIQTDIMFRMPALELVQAQQDNKAKVYSYLFTWKSPAMGGQLGACHALEIGFVFGKYEPMFCGAGPDADKLADCMQDAWLAFTKTGDPSSTCAGKWPVYGKERNTMVFDKNTRVVAAPYDEERAAWDNVTRKTDIIP